MLYLDDILIYSKKFEGHLQHIRLTLKRLREKVWTWKKNFFQRQVAFLGHIVLLERYCLILDHALPVKNYLEAPPHNIGEVWHLLGLVGFSDDTWWILVKLQNHYMISSRSKISKIKSYHHKSYRYFLESSHREALQNLIAIITEHVLWHFWILNYHLFYMWNISIGKIFQTTLGVFWLNCKTMVRSSQEVKYQWSRSWWKSLSYRNQFIDWFLGDRDLRHERVK